MEHHSVPMRIVFRVKKIKITRASNGLGRRRERKKCPQLVGRMQEITFHLILAFALRAVGSEVGGRGKPTGRRAWGSSAWSLVWSGPRRTSALPEGRLGNK